jgi:hypothetical protein
MCLNPECNTPLAPIHCKEKCKRCYSRDKTRLERKNPEILARRNASARKHYHKHVEYQREYRRQHHRLHRYGLSYEEFLALLEKQDHKCAICGVQMEQKERDANVDHDHVTKKVRGLLCRLCNVGVGHFRDDVELLLKAAAYLENAAK